MTWARKLALVGALGAFVVISFVTASTGQTTGDHDLPRASKVVVFGIPRLGLEDVTAERMPTLTRLARGGATGALRVKTVGALPDVAESYATIGAGTALSTGSLGMAAYDATELYRGSDALRGQRLRTGKAVHGAVVVPSMPILVETAGNVNGDGAYAGSLGTRLRASGKRTAVVSNADSVDESGSAQRIAPAALAVADRNGVVAGGTVSPKLTRPLPSAPYGRAVDDASFVAAVHDALRRNDVVVADPGETTRAGGYLVNQTPIQGARARAAALARTDAILGEVAASVPAGTLVLVMGVTPGSASWTLTPIVAIGDGVTRGHLVSPSTHRAGLATITDVAPTVLRTMGVTSPSDEGGHALRVQAGTTSWAPMRSLDSLLSSRATTNRVMVIVFIVAQALLYLVAMAALLRLGSSRRFAKAVEIAALTCAAWPLATFWLRASVSASSHGFTSIVFAWLLALLIAVLAQRLHRHPLDPLLVICGLTVATIVLDLATGAHLMLGSFFGYSPATATRYTGINNAAFAILAGCTTMACATLVDRADGRPDGWYYAATLAAVVVIADGAPWMGADVGGILTMVPVLALMLWALAGRRVNLRIVLIASLAAALALAVAIGIDALRVPDQRTHIGRFFLGAGEGNGQLFTSTVAQKWTENMRLFGQTIWAWMVPIIAGFSVYVLVIAKGWQRLLPAGSPRRIAVVSGLAMGIVGWLLNDSGVVVTALVFVYLGPLLLLLALRVPAEPEPPALDPTPRLQEAR